MFTLIFIFAKFQIVKTTNKGEKMKFLKAIVSAKKSHPESPGDLVFFSNKHSTAKGFADEIKAMLESEDENAAFWFAPKVEKTTIEEFEEYQSSLSESVEGSEVSEDFEVIEMDADEQIETTTSNGDEHYWFQYTVNNPIIIKVKNIGKHFYTSYKFESDFFIDIDRGFEKKENAVVYALGLVIDDCLQSKSYEHKEIIKGIGNRSESAICEALMSDADIKLMVDAGKIEQNKANIHEDSCNYNPEIEYKKIYSAIVDINVNYNGDKIPSAKDCYHWITYAALTYFEKDGFEIPDNFEEKIIPVISGIKNPYNFLNGNNVTQILMTAFPKIEVKKTESTITEQKIDDDCASQLPEGCIYPWGQKVEYPELIQADDLGFEFDDKKSELNEMIKRNFDVSEAEPEKSEFQKMVDYYNEKIKALEIGEVITFEDMPNEVYHASDGISSSQIKDAMISMMYFNAKYNTKEIERTGGSHFDVGNVFHSICLEPDLTSKEYICEPQGGEIPQKPSDSQLEKYNAWRKLGSPEKKDNPKAYPTDLVLERCGFWGDWYEQNAGLYPVAYDDWKIAEAMANSAMSDDDSSKILSHPARRCEVSYFKRCDVTGMIIKARPDVEIGRIIGDLKSISLRGNFDEKYLISALRKEVFNRNYHLSAAMYLDITGKDQFLWIFTNKQKGYHWTATVRASSEILERGRDLYVEYKQKIADSYNSGKWAKPESIQSKRTESGKIELPEI